MLLASCDSWLDREDFVGRFLANCDEATRCARSTLTVATGRERARRTITGSTIGRRCFYSPPSRASRPRERARRLLYVATRTEAVSVGYE